MDRSIPMLRATGQDETRSSMKFRCTRQVMPTGLPAWPLPMVAGWIRTAGRRRGRILQQSSFREDDVERSHQAKRFSHSLVVFSRQTIDWRQWDFQASCGSGASGRTSR
jgi:hypothetical protein